MELTKPTQNITKFKCRGQCHLAGLGINSLIKHTIHLIEFQFVCKMLLSFLT